MCGIAGFIDFKRQSGPDRMLETVRCMSDALINRGPDDSGAWCDADTGVAMGHRRLSIIDLSPEGHQPMLSAGGRFVLVFNGEIYNFQEIRAELDARLQHAAQRWRGHSDTEVMLAAFESWGVESAVKRFAGMFAFALWDREKRRLHLVRDRLGEKPLYYGWAGDTLLFGSELKALRAYPGFRGEIDRGALALYLRHNCIPAPYSIYRGVAKLPPGSMLTVDGRGGGAEPTPEAYWSAAEIAEAGVKDPFRGTEEEAVRHLDSLLREAIGRQMVADVPLGAFLSGGIDSSTVVAIMQAQSSRPVKTFTIGFQEQGYNEAEHAKAVARHLGTEHTELYVTPADALAAIPRLPTLYDEPFADSSQIPTFLVSRMTRDHVTVSLSGDGGDELFAGYNRHYWGLDIWRKTNLLPSVVRNFAARSLLAVTPRRWNAIYGGLGRLLPVKYRVPVPGHSLHKLADVLAAESPEEMYVRLVSHWREPSSVVIGAMEPPTLITDRNRRPALDDFTQRMMYWDLVTYLPDDILVKVDRAGMGVSLETRIPFLDHSLVEFAWRLPLAMKIRNGQGKWILRQVLKQYVPRELFERPKAGFGIPLDAWLRGPLREWAEALLDERRLRTEGFLNPVPIRFKWEEHLSGTRNWQYHLWDILMFQAWLESQS